MKNYFILFALIFLQGCSSGGDDGDVLKLRASYVSFADNWQGTLIEATTGSYGEVALTLQQSGGTLSGTWNAKFNRARSTVARSPAQCLAMIPSPTPP